MLIGSIVGSTDAAAVFAVVGDQNIKTRLKATVEAESGANDPMAIFLTMLTLDWVQAEPPPLWQALGFLIAQMGLGLAMGLLLGKVTGWTLSRIRFESSGLYPILLFGTAMFTFAATSWLGGSGFVAVYVVGIMLGNLELPYRQSILRFHEGSAWLAQMTMFILLGLLVFPRQLTPVIVPGLIIAGGLMFVARPVAVWVSTVGMGFTTRGRVLLAWAGLRGAVPIVLATFPLLAGVQHSNLIFNIVFFVVLTSALIQGSTISWVADRLGLTTQATSAHAMTLELVAMDNLDVDMVELSVPTGSPAAGKRLAQLSLPEQVTVCALIRTGRVITPRGATQLQVGDDLFILAKKTQSHRVRAIFEGAEDSDSSG